MNTESQELKNRIRDEMQSEYANSLEKNFDLAKKYFKITSEGKVDVIVKSKLSARNAVALYLIGKHYTLGADFSKTEFVSNQELQEELGIKKGTIDPVLKKLSDKGYLKKKKDGKGTLYSFKVILIEETLKSIDKLLDKK